MKTVKVKNVIIGEGMPKICVPIVGRTAEDIIRQAEMTAEASCDLVEIRIDYFEHYDANNEAFDLSLTDEEIIIGGRTAVGANDQKIIRYLRALLTTIKTFTEEQEEKIKRMIEVWENGDIPATDTKNILKSIKNIEDGVEAYYKIAEQIDDKYLEGRRQMTIKHDGEKQVILSCYMKGVKPSE